MLAALPMNPRGLAVKEDIVKTRVEFISRDTRHTKHAVR
jgi:hypothetical protein